MMKPLISVIIPVYNCEKYIGNALSSVFAQTYKNIEIIIVDDGSTDNTASLIQNMIKSYNVQYVRQENKGPSASRNLGISHANGKYIAFLDNDDIWYPNKLELQAQLLDARSDVGLVFCNANIIDDKGRNIEIRRYKDCYKAEALERLLQGCFILTPSMVMVRRSCIDSVGVYDEKLWWSDWELYVRIAKKYAIDFIDQFLIKYRMHQLNGCKNIHNRNKYTLKTLNAIWSGMELSQMYPNIKKEAYFKNALDLGLDNLDQYIMKTARSYFLLGISNKPICIQAYYYLAKTFLNPKIYRWTRRLKARLLNES